MSIIKNSKGVSLVETMVALGITAVAGVAYMTHMQTVAKNEARQKLRSTLETLNAEANNYLQSREICQSNVGEAFSTVPLVGLEKDGRLGYSVLKNKGYRDASGALIQKDIFKAGDLLEAGRIHVKSVKYKITELTDITIPSSPWTKSGKIKISVDFETCRDNGPVLIRNQSGVLVDRCPAAQRTVTSKTFEKLAAFKTNSTGFILTDGAGKKRLACADSQDALVEEAQNYTDAKVCLLEAKMQAQMGRSGLTSCNYNVIVTPRSIKQDGPFNTTITIGNIVATGGMDFKMIGAGGGGAGGWKSAGGLGGKAGVFIQRNIVESSIQNATCTINIPGRPAIAGRQSNGKSGGTSTFNCTGPVSLNIAASGGAGGTRGHDSKDSGSDGDSSFFGPGGHGAPYGKRCKAGDGAPGAGGGGGCSKGKGYEGARGGPGRIELEWKEVKLFNADNIEIDFSGNPV